MVVIVTVVAAQVLTLVATTTDHAIGSRGDVASGVTRHRFGQEFEPKASPAPGASRPFASCTTALVPRSDRMRGFDMVKLVFCCRRKPEMSVEDFHHYWLESHGPLVRSLRGAFPSMRRYVAGAVMPAKDGPS